MKHATRRLKRLGMVVLAFFICWAIGYYPLSLLLPGSNPGVLPAFIMHAVLGAIAIGAVIMALIGLLLPICLLWFFITDGEETKRERIW